MVKEVRKSLSSLISVQYLITLLVNKSYVAVSKDIKIPQKYKTIEFDDNSFVEVGGSGEKIEKNKWNIIDLGVINNTEKRRIISDLEGLEI